MRYRKKSFKVDDISDMKRRLEDNFSYDIHTLGDSFIIRSLKFSTYKDVEYSLVYYRRDASYIELHKKKIYHDSYDLERIPLTEEEVEAIFSKDGSDLLRPIKPLLEELLARVTSDDIRPLEIYENETYVFEYHLSETKIILSTKERVSHMIDDFFKDDMICEINNEARIDVIYKELLPSTILTIITEAKDLDLISKLATS